ncbi:MAG TPA: cell division protein SepF [Acidimicrobiales bacterium]|nr:cell division protein SepF [Acidimicrobiales bacterium]
MSAFRKAMVWLGLAPDEEYDDYGYDQPSRPAPVPPRQQGGWGPGQAPGRPGMAPQAAPEPEDPTAAYGRGQGARPTGAVRPLPSRSPQRQPEPVRPEPREETPTVRPMRPTSAKPTVVAPESFDSAKDVADRFKAGQPVVMDLSGADRDLARRLIDFSSGMCYALGGNMERVTPGVYLITPVGVEVSGEERRRLAGGR